MESLKTQHLGFGIAKSLTPPRDYLEHTPELLSLGINKKTPLAQLATK